MRQDRGHPGAQPLALVERAVPDQHAGDVDERVALARGKAADRVAQLPKSPAHRRSIDSRGVQVIARTAAAPTAATSTTASSGARSATATAAQRQPAAPGVDGQLLVARRTRP